jgi:chromosome segregation ATPase
MSGMIDGYFEELEEILAAIASGSGDIEEQVDDAEEVIKQIKIEMHSIPGARKQEVLAKVKGYETKLSGSKKKALFAGHSNSEQTKKIDAGDQAQQSLEILHKARAQLAETEDQGAKILVNLDQQKETIQHARGNLKTTNQSLSYSKKLLTGMSKWWRG